MVAVEESSVAVVAVVKAFSCSGRSVWWPWWQ